MKLQNKTALITGAAGVIGSRIALFFAREGCELVLSDRSDEKLKEVKNNLLSITTRVEIFSADVSKINDVKSLMQFAEEKFGKLDILVTAAGIYGEISAVEQCNAEKWMEAVEVNLFGTMLCVKFAMPMLKKSQQGKIVLFAGGGEGPLPNFTSYACSKGGILRLNESLAQEVSSYNIDVNAMYPGLINSGFVQDLIKAGPEKAGEKKYKEALNQVSGDAETISPDRAAQLALFLASSESNGLSGKLFAARWDKWAEFPKHLNEIMQSDIYTPRRIKPKDRGYEW